ncbi:MAG: hypothetical protein N3G80_01060 [Candidatus Micrarchaeota archaeon]|nr:hypothetical protein [Candidatus Micrarchaeota archaeon]
MRQLILKIKNLPKLASSVDPKDQAIYQFVKRQGIRTLSYKSYKYLYCLLCVENISVAVGGKRIKNLPEALGIWLSISKADKQTEISGKSAKIEGVPRDFFESMQPLLEAEVRSKNLSEFVLLREKIGQKLSSFFAFLLDDETHKKFWENITVAMMLLDTISDLAKDKKDGLVAKLDLRGLVLLAKKFVSSSVASINYLGILNSIRLLLAPTLLTIRGGFENEAKKEQEQPLPDCF